MTGLILMTLALQAAAPTPEAEALGRRLADTGTLATLLPMVSAKDGEDLVAAHPELNDADKAELRATAKAMADKGIEALLAAEGHAYASALSIDDLKTLVATAESAAAKRLRKAMPMIIAGTMQSAGKIDLKADTIAAFCAKTGKACPAK